MTMRKAVLERAYRKSISKNPEFQNSILADTTNMSTISKEPVKSSASKKKGKQKKKQTQKQKENSPPIAQSTMIDQTSTINISGSIIEEIQNSLPNKNENEDNLSSTLTKDNGPLNLSSQQSLDKVVQYQFKYERLCAILEEFKVDQAKLISKRQQEVESFKKEKAKLLNELYSVETELLNTEEELKQVREENNKLKVELSQQKKEQDSDVEAVEAVEEDNPSTTKTLPDNTINALPKRLKERKSLLSKSINTIARERKKTIEEIYQEHIIGQQDVLDLYSLLTGTSVYKPVKKINEDGENNVSMSPDEPPKSLACCCTVQLDNELNGYQFDVLLDYEKSELIYKPPESLEENPYFTLLPETLRSLKTYPADDAYFLVREFTESIKTGEEK